MIKQDYLQSYDTTELFYVATQTNQAKAVVVIVHGLCEHLGRYDYVTKRFVEAGMSVYRFDHRGHGRSKGERVYFANQQQIVKDVKSVVDLAKRENPSLPIFLLGHSMGGLASVAFVSTYPGEIAGIITSGALTRDNRGLFTLPPAEVPDNTYFPNELSDGVCTDPQVIEDYMNDPLVEKQISVGLVRALLPLVTWLREYPSRFTAPCLLLHGAGDMLVSEEDSRQLFAEIASDDKSLQIYAKLGHEILNEPAKSQILNNIIYWINLHV